MKMVEINLHKEHLFLQTEDIDEESITCFILTGRVNIINSNCVIIKSPEQIVIIDPGGLQSQAEYIEEIIGHYNYNNSPVYVLLTHCHIDHSYNLFRLFQQKKIKFKTIMNQVCADIFAVVINRNVLLEDFLDFKIPSYIPDIILPDISEISGSGLNVEIDICCSNNQLIYKKTSVLKEIEISSYQLIVGDIVIECLSTPGHSPDSTCFRVENVLITGDILFAANMGIAGTIGWSLKDLKHSVWALFNYLLQEEFIDAIVSGHGPIINKTQALSIIEKKISYLKILKILN
ncbi:MBL fold metallo-hydrolase [Candidatus Contubernalis alkaliaceticus]|uniref:MBL fold metallo-hydrolase n=1 Tax=Candidatus Contubernalis alkaliaceticus TaxID=338645 RepID=UPI001F4BD92E|nr:MBL fold metallo-hydrolase [Candidatus Contubernalis alkalaceticus]UNC92215.1 MBL fold metallo-hydrolase [Candidatus Contubernalis alkalaceticus]